MGTLRRISEEVKREDQSGRRRYSFEDSSSDDAMTVTPLPIQASSMSKFSPTHSVAGSFYSSLQLARIDTVGKVVADERLGGFDLTTFESSSFLQQLPAKPRYYSTALSQEDKQALVIGEFNHNLKKYGLVDVKALEDFRGTLERDSTSPNSTEPEEPKSMKGQNTVSEPAARQDPRNRRSYLSVNTTVGVTSPGSLQRGRLSVASISPLSSLGLCEPRRASTGDYFSQQHRIRAQHSWSSSRIVSPLSFEQRTYRPQPHVTFDSMLAPHISGKGESFRGSSSAIKNGMTGAGDREEDVKKQVAKRRLSKMQSLPVMLSRKNRSGDNRNSA